MKFLIWKCEKKSVILHHNYFRDMKKIKMILVAFCFGVLFTVLSGCNNEGCRGVGGKPRVHVPKHKPSGLFPKGAWGHNLIDPSFPSVKG